MTLDKNLYCIQWVLKDDKGKHKHFGPPLYGGTLKETPFPRNEAVALAKRADNHFKNAKHTVVTCNRESCVSLRT